MVLLVWGPETPAQGRCASLNGAPDEFLEVNRLPGPPADACVRLEGENLGLALEKLGAGKGHNTHTCQRQANVGHRRKSPALAKRRL